MTRHAQPFIPEGKQIEYVNLYNEFMREAFNIARSESLDKTMQTGSVIVKDGRIIGVGANGSDYHERYECERVKQGIPTGRGYELCEGCHPKNHSEPTAIRRAQEANYNTVGADLYLWGHWWCCEPCWQAMISADISNVYLLENADTLFNKEDPDNIVGQQIEYTIKELKLL
jgi:deoxycytidylate deaminase